MKSPHCTYDEQESRSNAPGMQNRVRIMSRVVLDGCADPPRLVSGERPLQPSGLGINSSNIHVQRGKSYSLE